MLAYSSTRRLGPITSLSTDPEAPIPSAPDSLARRISHWAPLLANFFWLQGTAQLLAIASGLLAVRALTVGDFALLTIAFAVQTTMVILADSGITQSLLARGGAVASERRRFSQVVQAALTLRRRFQTTALVVGLPILIVLLRSYDVSWGQCAFAGAAVAAALYGNVKQTVYSTVLFLQLRPMDAQRAAVASASGRFAFTVAAFLLFRHWVVFLAISAAAVVAQGLLAERRARLHFDDVDEASADDRAAMIVAFKNQLLGAVYFAFQPQITVWILTVFGTAQTVAEVGALTRLSIGFALITAAFSGLALPRFARYRDARMVRRRYVLLVGGMALVGAAAVAAAWLFPRLILSVLGHGYLHLEVELRWMVGATAVGLVSAAVHLLNTARGWVRGIWIGVPATILMQVLLALYVDLSSVKAAILIQASASAAPIAINVAIALRGMREGARAIAAPDRA
jgi:hypothetical protein